MRRRTVLLGVAALLCVPQAFAAEDPLGPAATSAFLAANAKKPGTITRLSGLQYRVMRSGTGKRPSTNDVVRVGYAMRLINGTLVDSTTPVLPAALAMSSVSLGGLAEALALMHEGDRWQLAIPANLAFGPKEAMGGAIPPHQALLMDVTLVSAASPQPGQSIPQSPFALWGNGRESGASFILRN
jgi:FKBP-type peptidyl-prolyl cis-trans isomerase FklB